MSNCHSIIITVISLLNSTLNTSGVVQFENANTALTVRNSTVALAGAVYFLNNKLSAIQVGTHSTILLAGTVEFTNNTGNYGGALLLNGGNITIEDNAQVIFQTNHAEIGGGAIASSQHVIAGSVRFINNSAVVGGAIIYIHW